MIYIYNITIYNNIRRPDLKRFRGEGRMRAASGTIGIGRAGGGAKRRVWKTQYIYNMYLEHAGR